MKDNAKNSSLFLTSAELASRWQVSTMTLRRWRKSGSIKTIHLGRCVRFALADVEQHELEARS